MTGKGISNKTEVNISAVRFRWSKYIGFIIQYPLIPAFFSVHTVCKKNSLMNFKNCFHKNLKLIDIVLNVSNRIRKNRF